MHESEEVELLDELVRAWVEVYKKSATTRVLRRLNGLGLLTVEDEPGRRTGARRHIHQLTDRGAAHLERIEASLISSPPPPRDSAGVEPQ